MVIGSLGHHLQFENWKTIRIYFFIRLLFFSFARIQNSRVGLCKDLWGTGVVVDKSPYCEVPWLPRWSERLVTANFLWEVCDCQAGVSDLWLPSCSEFKIMGFQPVEMVVTALDRKYLGILTRKNVNLYRKELQVGFFKRNVLHPGKACLRYVSEILGPSLLRPLQNQERWRNHLLVYRWTYTQIKFWISHWSGPWKPSLRMIKWVHFLLSSQ